MLSDVNFQIDVQYIFTNPVRQYSLFFCHGVLEFLFLFSERQVKIRTFIYFPLNSSSTYA